MSQKYTAGIRCFTYNQSEYIEETLNGFASQQTDFPFIAMVVDDASTDWEQAVISSYLEKNCDLADEAAYREETGYAEIVYARHRTNRNCHFVVLFLKENHYRKKLHNRKLEYLEKWRDACSYIALCEGDDWWNDPHKLQKQVDFLEKNPDYSMCCTNFSSIDGKTGVIRKGRDLSGRHTLGSLMRSNKVGTLTVLLRRDLLDKYEREVKPDLPSYPMGDLPIWLFMAMHGPIYRMKDYTSMYRVLEKSASHHSDIWKQYDFELTAYEIRLWFNKRFNLRYRSLINMRLLTLANRYSRDYSRKTGQGRMKLYIDTLRYTIDNHPSKKI